MDDGQLKYSDFIQPDNSVEKLIGQLEELQKQYGELFDKVKKDAADALKSLEAVTGTTDKHKEAVKQSINQADRLAKSYDNLKASQTETGKELAQLRLQQQKQNNLNKLTAKLNEAAEGSYDQLSAQYSLNKIKLNAMSKEQRGATEAGKALVKETNSIYEEMKRLQEETGKHTLSVGDYKKGWEGVKEGLDGIPGAAGNTISGIKGINTSLKGLLANPIVLLIAGIVGGLTALFALFKKTKAGSDLFAKSSAALSGVISGLVGFVDQLYQNLMVAFENPQQAIKDLWVAIQDNIVNRFKGLLDLFIKVGDGLEALWNGDLPGLKKAAAEAGQAVIQMTTGFDAEQQRDFAEAIGEATQKITDQTLAFIELEEAKLKTVRANREIEKTVENLITQEELRKAIADDVTKSFKERETAAAEAAALTIQRASLEQKAARDNLAVINQELDLRRKSGEDVEELLDKQLEAYKTLRAAEREYLLTVRDNEKRQSELKQDRLEKDLDILIDGFDNQKTINERLIADDSKTFAERQRLLEETQKIADESFRKQIATIEQFTDVQLDSNDLINESDAVTLNQKIRALGLSEIIEGRLLEVIRERRIVTQDLADAEQDLNAKRVENSRLEYDNQMRNFDQEYDFRMSEIDLVNDTEAEKTRLRLQAERERLKKIIELNRNGLGELSDIQISTMQNTIDKIDKEINKLEQDKQFDLYSAIGLKLNDDQRQAIADSTAYIVGNLQSILAANVAIADAGIRKNQEAIASAEQRLQAELEKQEQGLENNVQSARQEVAIAKQRERALLKEKEKAQKAQFLLDTIQQTSSLITASANIWKSMSPLGPWGVGLAVASIGTMFGSFIAAKAKARKLAQTQEFAEGGWEVLQGGSHASGNDISMGVNSKGVERRAEGGEAFAIINKRNTAKYRSILPSIFDSLNAGTFEKNFANSLINDPVYMQGAGFDNRELKSIGQDLSAIRERNEGKPTRYTDSSGRTVEEYRNVTTIYG